MHDWLVRQYRGEVTAATRILDFAREYAPERARRILGVIADQERQHAEWVLGLLEARGIEPSIDGAEERYWRETLPEVTSFEKGAAAALGSSAAKAAQNLANATAARLGTATPKNGTGEQAPASQR